MKDGGQKPMKSTYQARTGHGRYKEVKKSQNGAAMARRKRAVERLKAQLESGKKTARAREAIQEGDTWQEEVPLTEYDVKRIRKEISILEDKIKGKNVN